MNWKIKLEPAIIWKLVTCQQITLKRYSTSMGRHLSPRYDQVILVSGYPVLTAVKWSQDWCAICLQYQSSCAPKLESVIEHWLPCGADGRAGWGRCTVTWLPNFLGWVDLLTHGAPQARFARQSSATILLSRNYVMQPRDDKQGNRNQTVHTQLQFINIQH